MSVRFLHTGDLHLGSPLESVRLDDDARDTLRRATYDALERIVDLAIDRDVAFVVVAGDLYDDRARSVEANQFLIDQFTRLGAAGIPCYLVHGNHDPLYDGAETLAWPDEVVVFPADDVESVTVPPDGPPAVRILGQSYGKQWESNSLYWHYTPEDRSVPNVGLLHTGLDPDGNRYAPCSPTDLATKEIDYWALGHIHTPSRVEGAPAAYPGIPQGRHFGETPVGGCLLVELSERGDPAIEFVPTSPVVWRELVVDVGADATAEGDASIERLGDVESLLVERCQRLRETDYADHCSSSLDLPIAEIEREPVGVVCRVRLTGRGAVYDQLDSEAIDWLLDQVRSQLPDGRPALWIESIRDETAPPLPDHETLVAENETIAELDDLVADLRSRESVRRELREVAGEIWHWTTAASREDVPEDRLALDEDRLDDLIDRAAWRATNEIALDQYDVD